MFQWERCEPEKGDGRKVSLSNKPLANHDAEFPRLFRGLFDDPDNARFS